jgi:phosphoribosyl 1,2-cyclic phosphodiesterase
MQNVRRGELKLCILGSGSGGNAVLMQSGPTRILVDAGFSARAIARRLRSIGVDPHSIEAVVVTHEHSDHVTGVAIGVTRWGWKVYATAGTQDGSPSLADLGTQTISAGTEVEIGDFRLSIVTTSHDANEPVAVIATGFSTGVRAGIVYDLGVMTESVRQALERVDILVLESNHDDEMLRNGPYPASLKRRIAGRHGHLSNRAAGVAAAECAHNGMSHVVLAHLSETNNTPQTATDSMRAALRKTPFRGCIVAALQDGPSPTISAERAAAFGPAQLALGI